MCSRGVGREIDIGGIQRGSVGPGSDGGLIEDAVLDGGVETLNAPMQCALRRSRHDVTTYRTPWIVAGVKDYTTECKDGIRDTLKRCLLGVRRREVWVRETRDNFRIVAPEDLVPLQSNDAHISGFR